MNHDGFRVGLPNNQIRGELGTDGQEPGLRQILQWAVRQLGDVAPHKVPARVMVPELLRWVVHPELYPIRPASALELEIVDAGFVVQHELREGSGEATPIEEEVIR